jgi:hypothetical protein
MAGRTCKECGEPLLENGRCEFWEDHLWNADDYPVTEGDLDHLWRNR